ncbi:MAG: energy transducer TonB [Desulfobacca sp.]|nr:energy transducer TonB [Desulfobacca sp.]
MGSLKSVNYRPGVQNWTIPLVVSLILHGMILGGALFCYQELPKPRKVVVVEPISLTKAVPTPEPAGGGSPPPPPVKPEPKPKPKPKAVPPRPKPPKPVRREPQPEPVPPPPSLALARPAPPADVRPSSSRSTGSAASSSGGIGYGRGSGTGTGRGTGAGSGAGSGSGSILGNYLYQVRQLLERHKEYPAMARRRRLEGVVVLRFTIGANGDIRSQGIARSSSQPVLDQAAQETVKRVGRFPPIPEALQKSQLTIEVPLAFRLVGG